jgi:hypothetical protein
MLRKFILGAAIMALLVPNLASANVTRVHFPVGFTAYMPCAGEVVSFTGDGHLLWSDVNYHVDYRLLGVGQSTGNLYRDTPIVNAHTIERGATSIRLIDIFRLAGTNARFFLTFNSHGTLTAFHAEADTTCH